MGNSEYAAGTRDAILLCGSQTQPQTRTRMAQTEAEAQKLTRAAGTPKETDRWHTRSQRALPEYTGRGSLQCLLSR